MRPTIRIAIALVLTIALAPRCPAASYTVTDLGTLGGTNSYGFGINDSGQVTGISSTSSGPAHAFVYDGTMRDIGTLGGNQAFGYGINSSGQVTGYSDTSSDAHAFVYDGTMHDLDTLGGSYSLGYGINVSGQVTGASEAVSSGPASYYGGTPEPALPQPPPVRLPTHAFLYSGGMQDLGTLGGRNSCGYGINASGQVTGYSDTSSGGEHAFIYDGTMHDLGTLGGSYSYGRGINASGQVTGHAYLNGNSAAHAFVYDGTMRDLGTLGGGYSEGLGINSHGQVTGYSNISGDSAEHAFVYDAAHLMRDLNSLIDPSSGWVLNRGTGINDAGQITGSGLINEQAHAYLLTPVPEPSSFHLATAALLGLAARRWRRRKRAAQNDAMPRCNGSLS